MEDRRHGLRLKRHVIEIETIERELGPRLTNGTPLELVPGHPMANRAPIEKRRQREAIFDFSQIRLDDLYYMISKNFIIYTVTELLRSYCGLYSNLR